MDRFFVDSKYIDLKMKNVIISGSDVKHITKVLRYSTGDKLEICDKKNNEYICEIKKIDKGKIFSNIIEKIDIDRESNIKVIIYQGLPKSSKIEIILQKLTECGVYEIVLVNTERSVVNIDEKKTDKKIERWERIIYEAAKQSKRGCIPRLRGILSFSEAIEDMKKDKLNISPYENEKENTIKDVLRRDTFISEINKYKNNGEDVLIGVFIGPEGGFSQKENEIVKEMGVSSVTMGPRIFRTETAPIVATSIILYELGDIGGF